MGPDFWCGKRPAGVPDEIDLGNYGSLVEILEEAFRKYSDKPAFSCMRRTLTYRELDELSQAFAAYLQNETSLKPGDRIAIQLPNVLQYPVAAYGALRAGLVIVNVNPLYTTREMLHQFNDAGVKALLFLDMFGVLVEEVLPKTSIEYLMVTRVADLHKPLLRTVINGGMKYIRKLIPAFNLPQALSFRHVIQQGKKYTFKPVPLTRDDLALLQYTGGTTGVAKGAMLTHSNIIANVMQGKANTMQFDPKTGQRFSDLHGDEIIIAPLPFYHIYGFVVNCMMAIHMGDHNVLISNPRDYNMFIRELKRWKFTAIAGINTLYTGLMHHPKFKEIDFSSLKIVGAGGTALMKSVADEWKMKTGSVIVEGYGMTETSAVATLNSMSNPRLGSIGLPVSSTLLKVVDDEGNELPLGEPGELCIKGPQVMKGYWHNVEETEKAMDSEGWLRTGDIAIIGADGYVQIVDRKKDMIIVSGFNVYPNEIEEVVSKLSGVQNSAVIGVPDTKSGEVVKLFVVVDEGAVLTKDQVIAHCRASLTGYKIPKYVEFRTELPMTPVGKILRRELRDEMLRQLAERKPME